MINGADLLLDLEKRGGKEAVRENLERIARLEETASLEGEELLSLLTGLTREEEAELFAAARRVRERHYKKGVFLRGLIEFSSYCKNDCYYCGLRRSNRACSRYRLTREEILACARRGYALGFRTIVLQSGEDLHYSDEEIEEIISGIREQCPESAITLSIGEKSRESYERYYRAGADRYLLRQESIDPVHYGQLHPKELSIENRRRCLLDLKEIGYQVGCGIMVGSPFQKPEQIVKDLLFMKELRAQMAGIGPFIPHKDTPFKNEPAGSLALTLRILALVRLMNPKILLPATTALATIDPMGREKGLLAGANVIMPNLSPAGVKDKYTLYDGKKGSGQEAAEALEDLKGRIQAAGYEVSMGRGDYRGFQRKE